MLRKDRLFDYQRLLTPESVIQTTSGERLGSSPGGLTPGAVGDGQEAGNTTSFQITDVFSLILSYVSQNSAL